MSRLRLRPACLSRSHCSWCQVLSEAQPDIRRDDINRSVPHDEPLRLRLGKNQKAAAIRPLMAVGFTAGTPQRSNAKRRPRKVRVFRRSPSPDGVSLSTALLKSPMSTTAPGWRHISRTSRSNAMHTERILALSLLTWLFAMVKYAHDWLGEMRILRVTAIPVTAHDA